MNLLAKYDKLLEQTNLFQLIKSLLTLMSKTAEGSDLKHVK